MQLSLLTLNSAVQQQAAAAQAKCAQLINFTTGSVVRSIMEANAGLMLWLQWIVLQTLSVTRLATSVGGDIDTWVADYSFARLPARSATGAVTFSRFNAASVSALVPIGTQCLTLDGTQTFTVTIDTGNSAYSATQAGYIMAPNVAAVTVPVVAANAGTKGNVQVGTIGLISSVVSGVDTVTNTLAFSNGVDPESDAAVKARFPVYISGLSKATASAIGSAVLSVQQGLTYNIGVNVDAVGAYRPGNFVVTIDDGSGTPSAGLQALVYTAVDAVRSVAETFSVQAPTVTNVAISMIVTPATGYVKAALQAAIGGAVTAYVNALPIGASLYYANLARVAFDAAPGIASITGLTIAGAQADIAATATTVIKASSVSVS